MGLLLLAAPAAAQPADLVRQALAAGVDQIVFAVRGMGGDGHWYANFGYHSSNAGQMMYGLPGGRLCRLDLRTGQVRDILDDSQGAVRDPCVHYDGRRILFSYRRGDSRYYNLYEMEADGSGLRRITSGPYDDIEPIYLPDGDLLFCSSRCNRWVQCWFTQVAILYRCDSGGGDIRPVSANVEQDNTPWLMPDGRVLYMRWEYVDRSRVQFHHLWTMNPDGTGVMVFYGNMHAGTVMLDAKPIGGTNRVLSIFSPGHGQKEHAGRIAIVDPDAGPDEQRSVRYLAKGSNYRDPYPLTAELMLVAEGQRILLMDAAGQSQELYRCSDPRMYAHEPRPLVRRKREPILPSRVDPGQATGVFVLADVTHGRNMAGVRPGEIRKLLVLETLPKPVNHSGTMEPISHEGTFTLPRILGTVPVESDGSAHFEVPALRPVFFVALDANDLSVKRMQSFTNVMPGERLSCTGCHENRTDAVRRQRDLLATRRPPSRIEPVADVPDVMDFPRDIQPILDRHCVRCHNYRQRPPRDLPLVGARSPWYSHSYYAIMSRGLVSHGRDAMGNRPPRSIGSAASPLMKQIGAGSGAAMTALERRKVRLWIECGAPYPGTYAALGTGMVAAPLDAEVISRRCSACHAPGGGRRPEPVLKYPRELWTNLTEPAESPILLAPLSRAAGGWGACKGPVFKDTNDLDYEKLLADIEAARRRLQAIGRFDMPDFRPSEHYLREMRRYGILSAEPDSAAARVDPYRLDQAYWRSFWYVPPSGQ